MAVPNRAWAVGRCSGGPAVLYFNGTSWAIASLRNNGYPVGGGGEQMLFIHGSRSSDIWLAYVEACSPGTPNGLTLLEHYDADTDTFTTYGTIPCQCMELKVLSDGTAIIVGRTNFGVYDPAFYRYDGSAWAVYDTFGTGISGTRPFAMAITDHVAADMNIGIHGEHAGQGSPYVGVAFNDVTNWPGWSLYRQYGTTHLARYRNGLAPGTPPPPPPFTPWFDRPAAVAHDPVSDYFWMAVGNAAWVSGDRPVQVYRSTGRSSDTGQVLPAYFTCDAFPSPDHYLVGIGQQTTDEPRLLVRNGRIWIGSTLLTAATSRTAYYDGSSWIYYPAAAPGKNWKNFGIDGSIDGDHIWMAAYDVGAVGGLMCYWNGTGWDEHSVKALVGGAGISYMDGVFVLPALPPVAAFRGRPVSGLPILSVEFEDRSLYAPTSWAWDFGDGKTSSEQNPTHDYEIPGVYDVELIASNAQGSDSEEKTEYIEVLRSAYADGGAAAVVGTGSAELIEVDGSDTNFRSVISLDGASYVLDLAWNTRDGRWYAALGNMNGDPLVTGVPIVVDTPLFSRHSSSEMPHGDLIAFDTRGGSEEIVEPDELGDRVKLLYFPSGIEAEPSARAEETASTVPPSAVEAVDEYTSWAEIFRDDFDDGSVTLDESDPLGICVPTEAGGTLTMPVGGGSNADWWSGALEYAPVLSRSISPVGIQAYESKMTGLTGTGDLVAGLVLWLDRNNAYLFDLSDTWVLAVSTIIADSTDQAVARVTLSDPGVTPLLQRIIYHVDSGALFFEYSIDDGETWVQLWGTMIAFAPNKIGLFVKNWGSHPAITGEWDRLVIYQGTLHAAVEAFTPTAEVAPVDAQLIVVPADVTNFRAQILLDGTTYAIELSWNTRDARWYLSLLTATGDPLVSGVPVVVDTPLLSRYVSSEMPPGDLIAFDTRGGGEEMTEPDELGDRVKLLYFPEST